MTTFINASAEIFSFDAKTNEEFTEDAEVTENPVEAGGFVTDHRADRPLILNVEGIVSESPFEGQANPANVLEGPTAGSRGLTGLVFFRKARGDVFTYISTRLGILNNLALQSIKTSTDGFRRTRFSLTFKRVQFASSRVVDIPPEFVPKPSVVPILQCGEQATTDVTGAANTGASSILYNADKFTNSTLADIATNGAETLAQWLR